MAQTAEKLSAIIGLVAGGSGISIVPESLRYMRVPSVVFRPLADIQLVSELAVAHRRDQRSPAVNFLLTRLGEGALYRKIGKARENSEIGKYIFDSRSEVQGIRNVESRAEVA